MDLVFSHGSTAEHASAPCGGILTRYRATYLYFTGFSEAHRSERTVGTCTYWTTPSQNDPPPDQPNLFVIGDWVFPGGPVFAEKTYSGSVPASGECGTSNGRWLEETRFELRHTPASS